MTFNKFDFGFGDRMFSLSGYLTSDLLGRSDCDVTWTISQFEEFAASLGKNYTQVRDFLLKYELAKRAGSSYY